MAKNMYRTSYSDMTYGREVSVKSDFPSGYGGHVPSVRHDVLFRNTAFDREMSLRKGNRNRDTHSSFEEQIAGVPCTTRFPLGAKRSPTYGTIPHDGTTTMPKAPWAIITTRREPLTHRTTPPTMKGPEAWSLPMSGSMSARGPRSASARTPNVPLSARGGGRVNEAALNAGSMLATDSPGQAGGPDILALTPRARPDSRAKRLDVDQSMPRRTPSEVNALAEHLQDPL